MLIMLSDIFLYCCFILFLFQTCTIWFFEKCRCNIRLEAHMIVIKEMQHRFDGIEVIFIFVTYTLYFILNKIGFQTFFQLNWNASESSSSHGAIGHMGYAIPWILNISVQLGRRLHLLVRVNSSETTNNLSINIHTIVTFIWFTCMVKIFHHYHVFIINKSSNFGKSAISNCISIWLFLCLLPTLCGRCHMKISG